MDGRKAVAAASLAAFGLLWADVSLDGPISSGDLGRLEWMVDHRSGLITPAEGLTELGNYAVLLGLGAVVGLVLWRRGRPLLVAVAPLLTLLVSGVGIARLKELVDRERPLAEIRLGPVSDWSFPSAHTGNSTALYVAALLVLLPGCTPNVRRSLIVATVVLCTVIGATRIVLTVHWPTDVVAGWALGTAVAIGVVETTRRGSAAAG